MSAHNFGRRYIPLGDFVSYAKHLNLPGSFLESKLEFAERIGVIVPAARVRFPDPVVRRWHLDRYQGDVITDAIEPDGPRLTAANALSDALANYRAHRVRSEPRRAHPLDSIAPNCRPFVTKKFSPKRFVEWSEFRTRIGKRGGHEFYDPGRAETYYHAWQVFQLAAFLRSGLTVLYDVFSSKPLQWPLDPRRPDLEITQNIEARHELRELRANARLFDAVANYCDLTDRALQAIGHDVIPNTSRLTKQASTRLHTASVAVARRIASGARLKPATLIKFIGVQCGLWNNGQSRQPTRVLDEYKRNVAKTIELLQLAYPRNSRNSIVERVGATGGWRRYALDVMFPDWVADQRRTVEPSLRLWIVPRLEPMPPPFSFDDADVAGFCDWIEREGFLQLYWHFRRLTEIGPFDDQIGRSAATAEVVALASLVEHLVTQMLRARRPCPRSVLRKTLLLKVRELLRAKHGTLDAQLHDNRALTTTDALPLRRQLGRIAKASFAGRNAAVLKALLRLVVIRNASTHAGLPGFSRDEMQLFIESLLIAALVLWKAR